MFVGDEEFCRSGHIAHGERVFASRKASVCRKSCSASFGRQLSLINHSCKEPILIIQLLARGLKQSLPKQFSCSIEVRVRIFNGSIVNIPYRPDCIGGDAGQRNISIPADGPHAFLLDPVLVRHRNME